MKTRMNIKNLMISFLAIASVLFLVATVSAAVPLANILNVEVNGVAESGSQDISVVAGEIITVEVEFTAIEDAENVRIEAELEGEKVDVDTVIGPFDVINGLRYSKTLSIEVPYELKDDAYNDLSLNIKIWNGDYRTEANEIVLVVQRPTYNAEIMSIVTDNKVTAGETFPVDIVLKNIGYNDLDELYVTAKIAGVNVEKTVYLGDLIALEDEDDDEEDTTLSGRVFLKVPYDIESGIYTLEVKVQNDDLNVIKARQIVVENAFNKVVIPSDDGLLIVNPTDNMVVYKIIPEASGDLDITVSKSLVVVPEGSSTWVKVTADGVSKGTYVYDINILAVDGTLVDSVTLTSKVEGGVANPVIVLTIILAVIFLVLLVVLIVLIGKKPEQTEEFGESYY